ncbi:MAG: flagellar hook-length control protein FliK [Candidatus Aquilonibacter sp.]
MIEVTMLSIASVLPASIERLATGSTAHASGKGKGAHWASLFGSTLANAKGTSSSSPSSTATNADLLAQLTSLLQNGTPMTTIVDQLAQSVGTSAANMLKAQYSQSDLDRLRTSITQTIANALSPPSNGPPGTAAEEAAALATRLQGLVETIARDAENGNGQQNEIAGNILDANSAKELPAQQQTNGTASTLDVSSIVGSLLASVVAALKAPAPNAAPAVRPTPSPVQAASTPIQLATQQTTTPVATDAQNNAPSTLTSGLLSQATANAVGSQQTITMSNAPDLLARMLVRAVGVDASVNAGAAAAGADNAAGATALVPSGASALTPTMLAAKLAAMLTDVDAGAVTAGSSSTNTSTSNSSGHTFGQDLADQTPSGANPASLIAAPSSNLNSQVQDALQSSSSNGNTVDPNQIIEQMVSGMTMRTLAQGTSEIRLQLQPENLGQVTMRLTVSGNQVSANFIAQSADVRSALVANHQDLARSLSEAGLTLSGFSVNVSGGDAGQDQSKDRTTGFGRRFVVHELNATATADTTEASTLGPSLLSGSGLELFNSLA